MADQLINTTNQGERVTSTYAENYFSDVYCDYQESDSRSGQDETEQYGKPHPLVDESVGSSWYSPSDALIGIIELKPPFTSKIIRGRTHEGILSIGDGVLQEERKQFEKYLAELLDDNEAAWIYILKYEKQAVVEKVSDIYEQVYLNKTEIMKKEMAFFYEKSLQELEDHVRGEIKNVLISAHSNIISGLNTEIEKKLKQERFVLEKILNKKCSEEIGKIKVYYKTLLKNQLILQENLLTELLVDRNDALKAFVRQLEAETLTSTMYVMSTERKKCLIRKFILDNYQNCEVSEKVEKIKERKNMLDEYKNRDIPINAINREWEQKIQKILDLFLKFISFSLKLLPEQSTFLFDLINMVVLQLNEIQKAPKEIPPNILMEEEKLKNSYEFCTTSKSEPVCDKGPFVIEGDPSDLPPVIYGSRETLNSDVPLPLIRVKRQFIYAECHNYEQIKEFIEEQRCKCNDYLIKHLEPEPLKAIEQQQVAPVNTPKEDFSLESLVVGDINLFKHCPAIKCTNWVKKCTFPFLDSYLDYSEENYKRVTTILGKQPSKHPIPELLKPQDIAHKDLPFSVTTEKYHTVATQYSSQESINILETTCTCAETPAVGQSKSRIIIPETSDEKTDRLMKKRNQSITKMLHEKPNVFEVFTDERYNIKI